MADETPAEDVEQQPEPVAGEDIGNWVFTDPPTADQVMGLLKRLPDVFGASYAEFADWVQPLPQKRKVKKPHPQRPGVMVDVNVETWTLYVSVAGRLRMLQAIAEQRGWRVEFEPEPTTPTGIPGMLQYDQKVVYREYLTIWSPDGPWRLVDEESDGVQTFGQAHVREWQQVGRKPGTAWVPASGGKGAAGTNFIEKVETAARGRAIAAWGIGVLPGSGVASLEEMQGAADPARQNTPPSDEVGQRSPEELLSQARMLLTQVRQARGLTQEQAEEIAGQRLAGMGVVSPYDAEAGEVDWKKPNTGQLTLLIEDLKAALRQTEGQQLMEDGL